MSGTSGRAFSALAALEHFFGSWRFPVFGMTLVASYELLFLLLLVYPSGGELGSFAQEFRTWCFGYDPATGGMEWASIVTTFTSPLLLVGLMALIWAEPIRSVFRRRPSATIPYAGSAFLLAATSGALLLTLELEPNTGELPFPAAELRTAYAAPDFALTDQEGQLVSLADLRGKVVLMTAVYSRCGYTCPMIMGQAKRVVAELSDDELRDLVIVGVTLDPAHDTPEVLAMMAAGQQVSAPLFHLCTGEPDTVEDLLDHMEVARKRDPETGVIDHTNLFLLVDCDGKLAYRLSLGDRQERWLKAAIGELLREVAEQE